MWYGNLPFFFFALLLTKIKLKPFNFTVLFDAFNLILVTATSEDKEIWITESGSHCTCHLKEPEKYEQKIYELVKKYC